MYFCPFNFWRLPIDEKTQILDFKFGDVNGDGIFDSVYLIGEKNYGEESSFIENIKIVIVDGFTYALTTIPLKSNAGYNPRLFLGKFTSSQDISLDEIFVSIFSGGSGGMSFYYIYSYLDNKINMLFDYEVFDEEYKYTISYKDNYKVQVINKTLKNEYTIDIEYKGLDYLSEIYDENGKLLKPLEGYVVPVSGLYPVDYNGDNIFELLSYRRIIGKYNADSLGIINLSLKWNKDMYEVFWENVSIYGRDLDNIVV
ncbi:MAG: VCBS repeat-containing protein [Clostridiaceae bacterium]